MDYLNPPAAPAPVIVVRDDGGTVSHYTSQTAIYRAQGREVQLLDCRSACTLALSLRNVCVYPWSVLRFHTATNFSTRDVDPIVTDVLFNSYPPAIRARLGRLTPNDQTLGGAELISLGVRDCSKVSNVQIVPPSSSTAGANPFADLAGGVTRMFGYSNGQAEPQDDGPRQSPAQLPSSTPVTGPPRGAPNRDAPRRRSTTDAAR